MRIKAFVWPFLTGLLAGVVLWEGPRAWLVQRAQARRAADALAPYAGAGLERTAAGFTDATRLMTGLSVALFLVLIAVAALLTMAILQPDSPQRMRLARWAAVGMGVLTGAIGALYVRVLL